MYCYNLLQLTIYFCLINIVFSFDLNSLIGTQKPTEPVHGAAIELGSVEIKDEKCDLVLTPYLQKCKDIYHEKIKTVALESGNDFRTESVKRAACCGIWQAKKCVVKASQELRECGRNVSKLYEQLPNDPKIQSDVLDKCSEYGEYSAICREDMATNWFTMNSLILTLVIIMAITICALLAFKIIQEKMHPGKNNNTDEYNMVNKLDDYSSMA